MNARTIASPATPETCRLPDGITETFRYDERGRLIQHVSFEGAVKRLAYHATSGRLVRESFYDNLAQYDDGNGSPSEQVAYLYDARGRRVAATRSDGAGSVLRQESWQYDALGQLTFHASEEGILHYKYDALGRKTDTWIVPEASPTADASYRVSYGYDELGRLASVTTHERNGQDLLTPEVTAYRYDLRGNLDAQTLASGTLVDYVYDDLDRLTQVWRKLSDATPDNLEDNPVQASFRYTLRSDGRRVAADELLGAAAGWLRPDSDWQYDALGRLTAETITEAAAQRVDQRIDDVFDLAGNRLYRTIDRDGDAVVDEAIRYTYDGNDRLLAEEHDLDADGNDPSRGRFGEGGRQFGESSSELGGLERAQDCIEAVVRRDTVLEAEELAEPLDSSAAELYDRYEVIGTG